MRRLKSEEHIHLSENVIKVLAQNRITTILEFLQTDVEKLSNLTKLSLPVVLSVRNDILTKYSAPLFNGNTVLSKILTKKLILSTGINGLDNVLNGGLPIGFITEVCGLADSGKTQLCFQLAINSVKTSNSNILYIDTKGDFSANRIQKILDANGYSHKEMAMIMFKIRIVHIWTMDELIELLKILKNKTLLIEKLSLIIIDSLPCLMLQFLGDENKIGLTLLNLFVNYSRYLCKELDLAMVCVNIQTRWIDRDAVDLEDCGEQSTSAVKEITYVETRNRCLGKYWQNIPALVLMLQKCERKDDHIKNSFISVNTLKTSNVTCIRNCILKVSDLGVT